MTEAEGGEDSREGGMRERELVRGGGREADVEEGGSDCSQII